MLGQLGQALKASPVEPNVVKELSYGIGQKSCRGCFIELYNATDYPIKINDWHFTAGIEQSFTSLDSIRLEPNRYLVLAKNKDQFSIENLYGIYEGIFSNSGEAISLSNKYGSIVDAVTYDDSQPWPTAADGSGASLALRNPTQDNSLASSWTGQKPTPGQPNQGVEINDPLPSDTPLGVPKETDPVVPAKTIGNFKVQLLAGLNNIAIPVKTPVPLTAKSLAQKIKATIIFRFDAANQQFEPFVPQAFESSNFNIDGGMGVVVNVMEAQEVTFTGTVWDNLSAAPASSNPEQNWAFAMVGLLDARIPAQDNIMAINRGRGWIGQRYGNQYTIVVLDRSRQPVVGLGDRIEISVGQRRLRYQVTEKDLRQAFAHLLY